MGTILNTMFFFGRTYTSPAPRILRALCVFAAVTSAFSMSGCSISTSLSDSVSSPFKWSSDSSSGSSAKREMSYQEDVQNYTEIYARSNNNTEGLRKGLTNIAEKHGITNWEADNSTYSAIGVGLAKASIPKPQVDIYISNLSSGDTAKAEAMQKGYDRGH